MKRKFSIFLNVAVLALCVCAIAIGVYSAKQASLNVGGAVGFIAHNCDVDVSGYIYGHSTTVDGFPVAESGKVALTTTNVRGSSATLDLGTIYFSDMTSSGDVNLITIGLTFTNQSSFDVEAVVSPQIITGIEVSTDVSSVILSDKNATDSSNVKTMTITLTCTSSNEIISISQDLLIINLEKYVPEPVHVENANDFFWNNTGNNSRSYVNMGTCRLGDDQEDSALRWYIFAKGNSDGTGMQAVTNVVETDTNGNLLSGTYWFILDYADYSYMQWYNGDDYKEYEKSNIKELLGSDFLTHYNISTNDNIYKAIDERTLPAEEASSDGQILACSEIANQKLWVLSPSELKYLNK